DYDGALADYEQVLRRDPTNHRAVLSRGVVHHSQGQPVAAEQDYSHALRMNPNYAFALRFRGQLRQEQKNYEGARQDLDELTRLEPGSVEDLVSLAIVQRVLGRRDEALQAAQRALQLDPLSIEAYRVRSSIFQESGEFTDADSDFRKAARLSVESGEDEASERLWASQLVRSHFAPLDVEDLSVTELQFSWQVRAELQRAIDRLFSESDARVGFSGLETIRCSWGLSTLLSRQSRDIVCTSPKYDELDLGEDRPLRCLQNGLWLLDGGQQKFAVLLKDAGDASIGVEIAVVRGESGDRLTAELTAELRKAVATCDSYRGKIVSLEWRRGYRGAAPGLFVHRLRTVGREDVVLRRETLELLDRNVIDFCSARPRLAALGLSGKKGLLFYGPPGTGKTHTIHYLAHALKGHTTLLISAEQFGLLGDYMSLARLYQPSVVVMEDVDLIARDRSTPSDRETLLNRLLNEMDGLRKDAEILFVLTTNRPEALEAALASRPGRVDQAIEFPPPDAEGRGRLALLYAGGLTISRRVAKHVVDRTEGVTASTIKELLRRSAQFLIQRAPDSSELSTEDVDCALEELLVTGGSLNRELLGAGARETGF
ncbi:MAG: AAA family ATPase, partial [Planctomycetota bacterium]